MNPFNPGDLVEYCNRKYEPDKKFLGLVLESHPSSNSIKVFWADLNEIQLFGTTTPGNWRLISEPR